MPHYRTLALVILTYCHRIEYHFRIVISSTHLVDKVKIKYHNHLFIKLKSVIQINVECVCAFQKLNGYMCQQYLALVLALLFCSMFIFIQNYYIVIFDVIKYTVVESVPLMVNNWKYRNTPFALCKMTGWTTDIFTTVIIENISSKKAQKEWKRQKIILTVHILFNICPYISVHLLSTDFALKIMTW